MNTNIQTEPVSVSVRPQKMDARNQKHQPKHKPTSVFSQLSDTDPDVQDQGWERLLKSAQDTGPRSNPKAWENLTKEMLRLFPKLYPAIVGRMVEVATARITTTSESLKENPHDASLHREHEHRREVLRKFCTGIVSSCEEFLAGDPDNLDRNRVVDVLIILFATLDTCLRCGDKDIIVRVTRYRQKFGCWWRHLPNSVEDMLRRRGIVEETMHVR